MDFSYTFRCGSLAHTLLPALHSASCMTASVSRRYWGFATSSILTAFPLSRNTFPCYGCSIYTQGKVLPLIWVITRTRDIYDRYGQL